MQRMLLRHLSNLRLFPALVVLAFIASLAGACSSSHDPADAGDTHATTADAGDGIAAPEVGEDIAPDLGADVPMQCYGDNPLVITELQIRPCEYDVEADAEWFEVRNVSAVDVDIRGWTIRDSADDFHAIPKDSPIIVPAGSFFVFAASALEGADYVYDGIQLTNGEDDLELLDSCGARVDMVAWDVHWPPRECASIQLTSSAYDPLLNDDYRYWCVSPGTSGDPASMGASNTKCTGFCGDGEQNGDEECDEGEDNNSDTEPDTCRTDCRDPWCGDGVHDEDEECDDGEEGNSDTLADACRTDCKVAWCGDGVRDEDEQCDDGVEGSESCSPACERLCTLSPGDVILTEIMRNSADDNDDGEYVELLNTTAAPVDLVGCVLRDADSDSHEICVPSLTIAAGERIVLARSALAEENGGLEPDYTYGGLTHGGACSGGSFQMSNTEDEVVLDCCGVVVDEVVYDDGDGWPDEAAHAMSLSPDSLDAESNDDPANWCDATADVPYGDGANFGTPGLPNTECYASADWCMIDRPSTAELRAGESFTVYVLFREEGATDVTTGIDEIVGLAVELGVGVGGSLPDDAWSWVSAEANTAWVDQISPDADQYRATFETTEPGDFDYAFRVSLDDGGHWVYCDGRGGAGANGSEDGYSPENAGELTVLPSPCENNPCTPPPADVCEDDGFTLRDYSSAPGHCTPDGEDYTCEYDYLLTDCRLEGGRCEDGACVAYPVASFGQIVITEIMYDPHFDLEEDDAEWFELYNNSDQTLTLNGCIVRDDSNHTTLVTGLSLDPMDYALFVRSDDTTVNGGLEPDHLFDFALLNDGGTLQLQCPDDSLVLQVVDSVTYDDGGTFPNARAASISLSRNAYGESYNDNGANWCLGESAYFVGSITPEMDNLGTPGAPNPLCPAPDRAVDWCRLQGPLQLEAAAGLPVSFTGRVFEEGVTDATDGVDPGAEPGMRGQVGYGLDGTSPETATDEWTWVDAEPTVGWDASLAEPGIDEYTATVITPPEGTYDVAFRFTLDNGVNWLYCDRDTGLLGEDGSENLYQIANAGSLETLVSPCSPSPCVTPPDPICTENGEDAIAYLPNGVCSIVGNEPVCDFESEMVYCSESGGHCEDGSCVDEAPMPFEVGQIVFTEIMYNPHYDLSDTYAEWFELYNASDETLYLEGCLVTDEGGGQSEVTNLLLDPGEYGLFVATVSYSENGNLFPDQTFSFALGNSGDSLYFECDGLLIDAVSYDAGGDYPEAEAYSLNLAPDALDAGLNDVASNWCLASEVYYEGSGGASEDNYGTPGSANSACPVVDTQIDWCRLQYPLDADEPAAAQFTVYGRVHELGITDQSTGSDAHPLLHAQVGWGPDGSDPATSPDDWTWSDAEANPRGPTRRSPETTNTWGASPRRRRGATTSPTDSRGTVGRPGPTATATQATAWTAARTATRRRRPAR